MLISSYLLENTILGSNSYCCLCLKTVESDAVLLQDEISYEDEEAPSSDVLLNILGTILDPEILTNLMPLNIICKQCIKEAIKVFKFIKMCRNSNEAITKSIEAVMDGLPMPCQIIPSKSLFLEINLSNFTSAPYYDVKKVLQSKKHSLKTFKNLLKNCFNEEYFKDLSPEIKSEDEISITIIQDKDTTKKNKNQLTIPSSDMRVDNTNQCKKCLKSFVSLQLLRQHFMRVHAPKNFTCHRCLKSYSTESYLKQHIYDSHTPSVCAICGKSYQNRHSLKMHELGHVTKITCTNCSREYKNQKSFIKHLLEICQRRQMELKSVATYTCDYCNKKFTRKGSLCVHIQFEHGNGKAHLCMWCNKKFSAVSRLKAHAVKHTKEKKFCCVLCGGRFVTKKSLLYHTRIHTGEKPHQCPLCEKRFLSTSRRAEHLKRQHNTMPILECEICKGKFKGRASLMRHRKRHFNPKTRVRIEIDNTHTQQIEK